jgi:hypothetical protein
MKSISAITVFSAALLCSNPAWPVQSDAPEIWSRGDAMRTSGLVDTQAQRNAFRQLVKAGNDTATLSFVHEIEQKSDWPAPVRERLLLDMVNELRSEPPRAVGPRVTAYLGQYQPTVLVPHDDHPQAGVPLYNIRAATVGVLNTWSRQEAAFEGAAYLAAGSHNLVEAYLAEDRFPRRRGLLDALETATPGQLKGVSEQALNTVEQQPELVELAGKAALINNDLDTLEALAARGSGAGIPGLFRRSAETLNAEQSSRLLAAAFINPSRSTTAQAIAHLAPGLRGDKPTAQLLIEALGDPELGSAAALELASAHSTEVLAQLKQIAGSGDRSLRTSRAGLALQLRDTMIRQEMRQ